MGYFAWCCAGLALTGPAAVVAQDVVPTSQEVVVEARKRPELIDKVPLSVQVVSADDIVRDHVRSLDELGQHLPNVLLNRRQDNEANVVIRGIGAFGNVQGVGFYLDDVQNFTDQSAAIADVERIDVLKGPQGTLYGGSSIGGAIRYALKRPGNDLGVEASVGYGTFDTLESFAAVNVPLADGLATRIVGYARRTDGYVANTMIGGRADRAYENGGRVALSWSPDPGASILIQVRHNVLDDGGNIYARVADARDYRREVAYNQRPYNHRAVTGVNAQGNIQLKNALLTVVGSVAHRSNRFRWDLDYGPADAVTLINGDRNTTRVLTQEVRLASATQGAWRWLVGAYYGAVKNRALTLNADVLLGRAAGGPRLIKNYSNGSTDERQAALFGTIGYDPGRWRFELGARLNRTDFTGVVRSTPEVRTPVRSTQVLPRASVGYDTGGALIYASIAAGTEPGKVNVQSPAGSAYRAERATSGEFGIKGTVARGRARYALALFYTDDRRRQLETLYANAAGVLTEETINIGRAVSYGVEATLDARIDDRLTIGLATGWLRARWADKQARFDLQPVDGLRIPNAPTATASLTTSYRLPLGNALALRLSTDSRLTGRFAWDVPNRAFQSTYLTVNTGIALEPRSPNPWSLSIQVQNVTGAKYFTEFNSNVFGPGQSLGAPGRPRMATATLTIRQ